MKDIIKYAVARKHYENEYSYDYVSQFAHYFAGEDDVVSYIDLKNAVHFDTENQAKDVLANEPEWVQKHHVIVPFLDRSYCCILVKAS